MRNFNRDLNIDGMRFRNRETQEPDLLELIKRNPHFASPLIDQLAITMDDVIGNDVKGNSEKDLFLATLLWQALTPRSTADGEES